MSKTSFQYQLLFEYFKCCRSFFVNKTLKAKKIEIQVNKKY